MLTNGAGNGMGTRLLRRTAAVSVALLALGVIVPKCAAKKPRKTIATGDGRPIRKVYIRTASANTALSVAGALAQDTCLRAISDENQADAVLDVGIALPGIEGGMPMPTVFVPSATAQTRDNAKTQSQRTASANCTSGKDGGCSNSYNAQGGDLGAELPAGFARSGGSGLDISLISTGKASHKLWEPEAHAKHPWIDQLRVAAGCPVCPSGHFNPRKDGTYRRWMESKCPGVLASGAQQ
ncbi:MAG: hypothetical protein ACYDC6_10545 [Acidobacteriaceae bacterium]